MLTRKRTNSLPQPTPLTFPTKVFKHEESVGFDARNVFEIRVTMDCILKFLTPMELLKFRFVSRTTREAVSLMFLRINTFRIPDGPHSFSRWFPPLVIKKTTHWRTEKCMDFLKCYMPNLRSLEGSSIRPIYLEENTIPAFPFLTSLSLLLKNEEDLLCYYRSIIRGGRIRHLKKLVLKVNAEDLATPDPELFFNPESDMRNLEELDLSECVGFENIFHKISETESWELPSLKKITLPRITQFNDADTKLICKAAKKLRKIVWHSTPLKSNRDIYETSVFIDELKHEVTHLVMDSSRVTPRPDERPDVLTIRNSNIFMGPSLEKVLECTALHSLEVYYWPLFLLDIFLKEISITGVLPQLKLLKFTGTVIYDWDKEFVLTINSPLQELDMDFLTCETDSASDSVLRFSAGPRLQGSLKRVHLALRDPNEPYRHKDHDRRMRALFGANHVAARSGLFTERRVPKWTSKNIAGEFLGSCQELEYVNLYMSDPLPHLVSEILEAVLDVELVRPRDSGMRFSIA